MTLGEKIRSIRGERSLKEFALMLGIPKDKVVQYETNHTVPSLSILARIAEIGQTSIDRLLRAYTKLS